MIKKVKGRLQVIVIFDEEFRYALQKQTFEKLKGMRLVILESALGSQSSALEFESKLQELMEKRRDALMANKNKGNKKNKKDKKEKSKNKKGQKK